MGCWGHPGSALQELRAGCMQPWPIGDRSPERPAGRARSSSSPRSACRRRCARGPERSAWVLRSRLAGTRGFDPHEKLSELRPRHWRGACFRLRRSCGSALDPMRSHKASAVCSGSVLPPDWSFSALLVTPRIPDWPSTGRDSRSGPMPSRRCRTAEWAWRELRAWPWSRPAASWRSPGCSTTAGALRRRRLPRSGDTSRCWADPPLQRTLPGSSAAAESGGRFRP
jgi:hypothetical protein